MQNLSQYLLSSCINNDFNHDKIFKDTMREPTIRNHLKDLQRKCFISLSLCSCSLVKCDTDGHYMTLHWPLVTMTISPGGEFMSYSYNNGRANSNISWHHQSQHNGAEPCIISQHRDVGWQVHLYNRQAGGQRCEGTMCRLCQLYKSQHIGGTWTGHNKKTIRLRYNKIVIIDSDPDSCHWRTDLNIFWAHGGYSRKQVGFDLHLVLRSL